MEKPNPNKPNTHDTKPSEQLVTRRRAIGLLGCSLAASALACVAGSGCTFKPYESHTEPVEVWKSKYNWKALLENPEGRRFYYPNNTLSSRFGIDVSDFEGEIDWKTVAQEDIEFVFVRIGYRGYTKGGIFDDAQAQANLKGARANEIPLGAYFFSSAINADEAKEEAQYVLDKLNGMVLDYPIVYDQEQVPDSQGRANNLTSEQYTANAKVFCETVVEAGYQAMIYGNQKHLALLKLSELSDYPIWYAEYGVKEPTGHFDFTIWQYSSGGVINGINATTDFNIHFLNA
ncbi:MAG: glycoside hydrolase family 25 protein [Coriobacteriales bacterium]|nr:glycoside hydrolase family 25 protein [Coriobacteriales bacterium]